MASVKNITRSYKDENHLLLRPIEQVTTFNLPLKEISLRAIMAGSQGQG